MLALLSAVFRRLFPSRVRVLKQSTSPLHPGQYAPEWHTWTDECGESHQYCSCKACLDLMDIPDKTFMKKVL
jgi:hypothetical protein